MNGLSAGSANLAGKTNDGLKLFASLCIWRLSEIRLRSGMQGAATSNSQDGFALRALDPAVNYRVCRALDQ
ncbi:MAG: hypothetical protein RSB42_07725, partial [Comamonas sp.]